MSVILEHMLQSQRFVPSNVEEYLALQLAKRLNDESAIKVIVHDVSRHPLPLLLRAYSRAKLADDTARAFHSFLNDTEP